MSEKKKFRLSRAGAAGAAVAAGAAGAAGAAVAQIWLSPTASVIRARELKFWIPESFELD